MQNSLDSRINKSNLAVSLILLFFKFNTRIQASIIYRVIVFLYKRAIFDEYLKNVPNDKNRNLLIIFGLP